MFFCAAVIFDLDGVLVHTDAFHYKAWKQLADANGIYFDEAINNRLRGVSRDESLAIVLERSPREFSCDEKQALAEQKNAVYRGFLTDMSPRDVSDATRSTLELLRAQGFRLAIGSSSKNTPLILENTQLACYFDAVSDGNGLVRSKPDPEVFLKAAERLGVPPAQCVVVEDAVAGAHAAHAAGMFALTVGDAAAHHAGDENMAQLQDMLSLIAYGE